MNCGPLVSEATALPTEPQPLPWPEITLYGYFHSEADLLFYWFGFSCFAYAELVTYLLVKQEVTRTVILPLQSN